MTKDVNILVAGGAGYIGSHVCREISRAGYSPIAYDNLVTGFKELVKWGEFENGDVLDAERLSAVMNKYKPAAVVHMAAYIAAGESVKNPAKYYRNNTFGGLALLETMQKCGVKNIVFSSTAAVYGIPAIVPIKEDTPTKPINPYGASKLMVEQMLHDFGVSAGIKYVALRYFNAAGADEDAETGCKHEQPNNLIPILMDVQTGKRDKIEIFGTDYETSDGTAIRDYIHVSDLARAHVKALEYLFADKESTILNLGTGRGYTVREVVQSVEKVTGKKVPYIDSPRRVGDPAILVADSSLAKTVLGWEAEYNNIDDITKTAWQWQLQLS